MDKTAFAFPRKNGQNNSASGSGVIPGKVDSMAKGGNLQVKGVGHTNGSNPVVNNTNNMNRGPIINPLSVPGGKISVRGAAPGNNATGRKSSSGNLQVKNVGHDNGIND